MFTAGTGVGTGIGAGAGTLAVRGKSNARVEESRPAKTSSKLGPAVTGGALAGGGAVGGAVDNGEAFTLGKKSRYGASCWRNVVPWGSHK